MDWGAFGRVLVLIDAANLNKGAEDLGFKVSYRPLANFFRAETRLYRIVYYSVESQSGSHANIFRLLTYYGYWIVSKPVKVISDRGSTYRKANFDVEITLDAMDWLTNYDTLVLFSGDSDFHALVKRLQSKGKAVVVCSLRGHISKELIASANHYRDVTQLSRRVLKKRRTD